MRKDFLNYCINNRPFLKGGIFIQLRHRNIGFKTEIVFLKDITTWPKYDEEWYNDEAYVLPFLLINVDKIITNDFSIIFPKEIVSSLSQEKKITQCYEHHQIVLTLLFKEQLIYAVLYSYQAGLEPLIEEHFIIEKI